MNEVRYDATDATCTGCRQRFNPSVGPANGQSACCPSCDHQFSIAKTVRASGIAPKHRLYAKLVLLPNGQKRYLPADNFDIQLFDDAKAELSSIDKPYPVANIEPGYNTNQALNYNYRQWHQFFNERQLVALSILGNRIREINNPEIRDLFLCLFSGVLEFNNMFTSYKGEGTGAVRHMFSHHILKPERTPLEANLWGTPKSSGSFSTLFASRILRALDYAENPFELFLEGDANNGKIFNISEAIGFHNAENYKDFSNKKRVYVSCGNSGYTDILEKSVDAIVTDPPFFDNVNYSQLADFFHVWQRHILDSEGCAPDATTRATDEVQHGDVDVFQDRLSSVWSECHRVLKDDGVMVFSYHHSRTEGWRSVLGALMNAGFDVVASHPVKAEMSVAMPKQQAKEPIDLDILLVCRKRSAPGQPLDTSRVMLN
ncbi:MAG: DNA methyltransferase, partial [Anaerolineales bacterium]